MVKIMKKIMFLIVVFSLASKTNAGIGALTAMCSDKQANVSLGYSAAAGKYLGFSARLSSGKIVDFDHIKIGRIISGTSKNYNIPKNTDAVRASTWKNYNKNTKLMAERVYDTGWISCK